MATLAARIFYKDTQESRHIQLAESVQPSPPSPPPQSDMVSASTLSLPPTSLPQRTPIASTVTNSRGIINQFASKMEFIDSRLIIDDDAAAAAAASADDDDDDVMNATKSTNCFVINRHYRYNNNNNCKCNTITNNKTNTGNHNNRHHQNINPCSLPTCSSSSCNNSNSNNTTTTITTSCFISNSDSYVNPIMLPSPLSIAFTAKNDTQALDSCLIAASVSTTAATTAGCVAAVTATKSDDAHPIIPSDLSLHNNYYRVAASDDFAYDAFSCKQHIVDDGVAAAHPTNDRVNNIGAAYDHNSDDDDDDDDDGLMRKRYYVIDLINELRQHFAGNYTQLTRTTQGGRKSVDNSAQHRQLFNSNWGVLWWQQMWVILYVLLYISTIQCNAARQEAPSNCTFPQRWEGQWFLSGYQQSVYIKGSTLSFRGKCVASDGDKFLVVDDKGCHRCLVIYEKHKNVLQYKESECEGDSMYMMDQSNPAAIPMRANTKIDHRGGAHPNKNGHSRLSSSDPYRSNDDNSNCPSDYCKGRDTLNNLCEQIAGDALLFSLFKVNTDPVKCPLKGPYTFTYNRGHGECKSPVSNIDSCTEDSRLLLSFQACPDIHGTESTLEELTCLATWKDGNSRYLVGLVSHTHAMSNEDKYRCFVYEKITSAMGGGSKDAEYKLAQSGDATCNGLDSAEVGSRIMSLRKAPPAERCDFPAWFKGPRHWHALMGNNGYNYHTSDGSMHITKSSGSMETRALCEQINKQTPTEMMAVVHFTTGCKSGFMCTMFYRRDTHVAEIQMGSAASRVEDACAPDHFDINKLPYITLLASSPDAEVCPKTGLYTLKGAIGPPYISSRHKRNHSNRVHNHSHHHHDGGGAGGGGGGGSAAVNSGHRKRDSLSFRNSEDFDDRGQWQKQTRGISVRNRRNAQAQQEDEIIDESVVQKEGELTERRRNYRKRRETVASSPKPQVAFNATSATAASNEAQRSRRDIPNCIPNYSAQRQLLIGCSAENVIEVRPQCNDDGDEVYTCHGSWTENQTVFVIAKHVGSVHAVCITYRPLEGNNVRLVIGDACYRGFNLPPDRHLVANLTIRGDCSVTSASPQHTLSNYWILIFVISWMGAMWATPRAQHR